MKMREYKQGDLEKVQRGIELLKQARELFRDAGVVRTTGRIRKALTSAQGAERHVSRLKFLSDNPQIREVMEASHG